MGNFRVARTERKWDMGWPGWLSRILTGEEDEVGREPVRGTEVRTGTGIGNRVFPRNGSRAGDILGTCRRNSACNKRTSVCGWGIWAQASSQLGPLPASEQVSKVCGTEAVSFS